MLPRSYRLRYEQDLKALFSKGKSVFDVLCRVKYRPNGLLVSRFAVVVGTKVSKSAVERNRIRRQAREEIRVLLPEIEGGQDVAVLVNPAARGKSASAIRRSVQTLLRRTPLLKRL